MSRSAESLAYDRIGHGPPLVLLHPLGADRHVWRPVISHLDAHRDVLTVDLPGFGGSAPLAAATPDPRALADAVSAWLAGLGLDGGRAHVAGNSLGGWVALELALRGDAASVTAIAPAGLWPRPLPVKPELARRLARLSLVPGFALALTPAFVRRAALLGTVAHPERVPPADAAALVRAYAGAPGFTAVNGAMRAGTFRELSRIRAPTTLVWPQDDRMVARARELPPRVQVIDLPGCGHIPMWDDPEKVAEALLAGSAHALAGGLEAPGRSAPRSLDGAA